VACFEGKGIVAPKRATESLTEDDLRTLCREAERRSEWRGYSSRSDRWGRGFAQASAVPGCGWVHASVMPALCGLVGEWAVCAYLNRELGWTEYRIDFSYQRHGDGGVDLVGEVSGLRLQVKCRRPSSSSPVRCTDARGNRVPLPDVRGFVFAEWRRGVTCDLLGWVQRRDVQSAPVHSSPVDTHLNYVIADAALEPMRRLVDLVDAAATLRRAR
jgi:hypothetical protein